MKGNLTKLIAALAVAIMLFSGCGSIDSDTKPQEDPYPDYVPLVFSSVDELADAIKNADSMENGRGKSLLETLEYFYAPAQTPEKYKLSYVEVLEHNIIFCYVPDHADGQSRERIQYIYFRGDKVTDDSDPFSVVLEQYDLTPTAEGLAYSEKDNSMFFRVGNSRMHVTVPDSLNSFAQMKKLCTAMLVEP